MNPYRNRGPIRRPEDFIGRQRELMEIRESITQGTWVSLIGERRVGKSSILNALRFDGEAMKAYGRGNYHFVFADCQLLADASEEEVIRFLLDLMDERSEVSALGTDRTSLSELAAIIAADPRGAQSILLLDEIDVLAHNRRVPQEFFGFLRGWSQRFQIPLVTASKESSIESLVWNDNVGSPFWNIFRPVYVGPFTRDEALQLISAPAESCGESFSDHEVEWLLAMGGHHPFFLQIACDYLFQAKAKDLTGPAAFEEADLNFRIEAMPHLEYLWRGLSDPERQSLIDFPAVKPSRDARIRPHLVKKGLLVDDGEVRRVFSRAFAEEVVDQGAPEPSAAAPLLHRLKIRFLS